MSRVIWITEDEPVQQQHVARVIKQRFQGVEVRTFSTEAEFRKELKLLTPENMPSLIVSDVMFPWDAPSETMETPPQDVIEGTFAKAGLRCHSAFRQVPACGSVPWIYFTVLGQNALVQKHFKDFPTYYVKKTNTMKLLMDRTAELLEWRESDDAVTRSFLSNPTMRDILRIGLNTSLSECSALG